MTGNDDRAGTEYDQPRVPAPLRERVEELFAAERGYEAASFQEALSAVVELADEGREARADQPDSDGATVSTASSVDSSSAPDSTAVSGDSTTGAADTTTAAADSTTGSSEQPDAAARDATGPDATDPDAGSSATDSESADEDPVTSVDPTSLDPDVDASVSFDEYVDGLEATSDDPSPAVESILDTEHADGVVRELAAEVLDEMTQDAFQELEHGVDQGVGAGVTDGMGAARTADGAATAPSGTTGDGVPDSLTADPESDCAVCGRAHRVSVLQTTILDEDGSVALVCPACAE